MAVRMLGSRAEAEDAVQETWLRASRSTDPHIDNVAAWLTTITARVCLNVLRSRSARREDPFDEVTVDRPGRSMAFVMDTRLCDAALELARGVDLLVCESTFLDTDRDLADRYMHMTARQAGELATAADARRLVLTHFSARYPDHSVFADEAGRYHDDVVAATDLAVIPVP